MRARHEVDWILEGRSPDQIPMHRLAEYMRLFATMLGEVKHVHFVRVEEGCTRLVAAMERGRPAQRVRARVYAIRDRRAPADAMHAYNRVNEMVAEDHGPARITFGAGAILRFPGRTTTPVRKLTVNDTGTVTGHLYYLAGQRNGQVNARITPRGSNRHVACIADSNVGRDLRRYFLEDVRAHGRGKWSRSEAGVWTCDTLHILEVSPVSSVSLREAVSALRAVDGKWPNDPLGTWASLQEDGSAA